MNKEEFLEKFKFILKLRWGTNQVSGSLGNDEDLRKCDFTGVYALFKDDELLYIGSGYTTETHTIKNRLSQYTKNGTGNTLIQKVIKESWASDNKSAIDVIKKFEFIAFEHIDLENHLINKTNCKWNINGSKKGK